MWHFDNEDTAKEVWRIALGRVMSQPHMVKYSIPVGDIATDLEGELSDFCEYCGRDFTLPGMRWPCHCQRYD